MSQPATAALNHALDDPGSSPDDTKPNILVGCTGSVASIKVPQLVAALSSLGNVKVVATDAASHFFTAADVTCRVYRDADEWSAWSQRGDPVLHIELRRWADVFLIAPLDANTLAKLANGLCDNLLTCVARAWDVRRRPLLFAPAMNTLMWEHPLTSRHVEQLTAFGYMYVPVVTKTLVCGDKGDGAMAEVKTLVQSVSDALQAAAAAPDASPAQSGSDK